MIMVKKLILIMLSFCVFSTTHTTPNDDLPHDKKNPLARFLMRSSSPQQIDALRKQAQTLLSQQNDLLRQIQIYEFPLVALSLEKSLTNNLDEEFESLKTTLLDKTIISPSGMQGLPLLSIEPTLKGFADFSPPLSQPLPNLQTSLISLIHMLENENKKYQEALQKHQASLPSPEIKKSLDDLFLLHQKNSKVKHWQTLLKADLLSFVQDAQKETNSFISSTVIQKLFADYEKKRHSLNQCLLERKKKGIPAWIILVLFFNNPSSLRISQL